MAIRPYKNNRYVVDFYDPAGKRRWKVMPNHAAAKAYEAEQHLRKARSPKLVPKLDPEITLGAYLDYWLKDVADTIQQATRVSYDWAVRKYIQPATIAHAKLRSLTREDCKMFMRTIRTEALARGGTAVLSKKSVKHVVGTLNTALAEAVDLELRLDNPMAGLRRRMRKIIAEQDDEAPARVRAFTQQELHLVLEAARVHRPSYYPLFVLLSRTGMRPGEGTGLQLPDLNFLGQKIRVTRSWSQFGYAKSTKTGRARTCDMSASLKSFLESWLKGSDAMWHARDLKRPDWLFPNSNGRPFNPSHTREAFSSVLKLTGLGDHTLYDLRHSFASLLLQAGVSIKYVQEQLGHADIKLTVHLYGSHLPAHNPGALDILDAPGQTLTVDATVEAPTELPLTTRAASDSPSSCSL